MSEGVGDNRETQLRLREHEEQIAALTRRVFQLEQALQGAAIPLPLPLPRVELAEIEEAPMPLHQQPLPTPIVPPSAEAAPQAETVAPPDWEGRFGTNWLNRAGIVLIVIGVVLFLGFAMAGMGPEGRIAIAAIGGVLMLAAGYWFDAKGDYRPWSLGVIAGGFAVLYATSFAAHAVGSARVIDNQSIGIGIQTLIAVAAIWQAVRFANERAATVAFFAAFLGVLSSDASEVRFAGSLPLTIGGIWLSIRMGWEMLPWGILIYSWLIGFATASRLGERQYWGQPVAWAYLAIFAGYEIWRRRNGESAWHALWILLNAGAFLCCTFGVAKFEDEDHQKAIFGLLALAGLGSSALRFFLGVRREALSEALAIAAAAIWVGGRVGPKDGLLAVMLILAIAMLTLVWNARERTLALTVLGEFLLGVCALILMIDFPESKVVGGGPLDIRLALPQTLTLMACLFAAGRWLTMFPWPSALGLVVLAEITLWTVPKTFGTILLSLEAIVAVAIGLYLNRRPIRLGGLVLFAFSILKVFFYDMAELDTLPRIFSFIVLGALLLGASWGYTRYRQELQKYL